MNTCGSVLEMQLLNIAENLDSRHIHNYSDSRVSCSDKSHNPLRKHDDHANNSSCKAHYRHLGQKRNPNRTLQFFNLHKVTASTGGSFSCPRLVEEAMNEPRLGSLQPTNTVSTD
jgi:hypothetical protein